MTDSSKHIPRPRNYDYKSEAADIINDTHASPLCTCNAAALVLGVTPKHVRELLKRGDLKGAKLGRAWRVNVADLCRIAGLE